LCGCFLMFNVDGRLPNQRFNLRTLAEDMGLGGQREREEHASPGTSSQGEIKTHKGALKWPASNTPEQHAAEQPEDAADALAQARQRAVEQREAAEALLLEARALEEKLFSETAAADAARERAQETAATASRAAAAEDYARKEALAAAERCTLLQAECRKIEAVVTSSRLASEAATAELAELKQRLEQVLRTAEESTTLLRTHEQLAAESAAKVIAAEKEAADAAAVLTYCQAERETAERDAKAAEVHANALGKGAPIAAPSTVGIEEVRALTARIAEQSKPR
jgi:hypothetical protein